LTTPILLCDLDNSLLKTDLLFETLLKLIRTKPWLITKLPAWCLKGKAHLKAMIAHHISLDPALLPYHDEVVRLVKARRQAGAKTVLISASNHELVTKIGEHCQYFDECVGSSNSVNLKGKNKLAWIEQHYQGAFEYIGDSTADLPIWTKASRAILVNPSALLTKKVQDLGVPYQAIHDRPNQLELVLKQIRPHQWVKNALIATPMIAAHRIYEPSLWLATLTAIASFSMIASLVYVMNDMLDVENDRKHPTKKARPFASGHLPIKAGFFLAPILGAISFLLASTIGWSFSGVILLYLAVNVVYSIRLKEEIMLDVVTLASFYTMRIMAGSAATNIAISPWLLSFSTFFFFGLAMVKRYTELLRLVSRNHNALHGRSYTGDDKIPVLVMGITSSLISILILALFFASPDVQVLHRYPGRLWMLAPILLFWTGRIWLLTHRGQVDDDPVVFAMKDKVSLASLLYVILVIALAN
jgi:4-hydroxybenzoate polyprenyltransferase